MLHNKMSKLLEFINNNNSFLISTHVLPDGDAIGSEIAFHHYLKSLGKEVKIVNTDPTPDKFAFVDEKNIIQTNYAENKTYDALFILDTNEVERIGSIWNSIKDKTSNVIFIDHHISQVELFNEHSLIDEEACSTGELLYKFFSHIKAPINNEMALAIYVALFTDSNGFSYSRTTSLTHQITAKLLETGINPEEIHQKIYARNSLSKMHLQGELLSSIRVSKRQTIAWIPLPMTILEKYKATSEDTQGFIKQLLLVDKIYVACVFREESPGKIKISLRSKQDIGIYNFAKQFGGGGHTYAAGVLIKGRLEEVIDSILVELELFIRETIKKAA